MAFGPRRSWWPQRRRAVLPTTSPSWCSFYASPRTLWPTVSETPKPALWRRAHRVLSSALEQTTERPSTFKATSATLPKPIVQRSTSFLRSALLPRKTKYGAWNGFDIGEEHPSSCSLAQGHAWGGITSNSTAGERVGRKLQPSLEDLIRRRKGGLTFLADLVCHGERMGFEQRRCRSGQNDNIAQAYR